MKFNFEKYNSLLKRVDELSEKLSTLHKPHMQCRKGCDLCCMDYRIFPLEYYSMQQALEERSIATLPSIDESCIFLKDHACQIYEHRPLICRTHGLPLLYLNDEQWELSACELNFTEFDDEAFDDENTFPQDTYNSELYMLNKAFIVEYKLPYSEVDLLEMKDLHKTGGIK